MLSSVFGEDNWAHDDPTGISAAVFERYKVTRGRPTCSHCKTRLEPHPLIVVVRPNFILPEDIARSPSFGVKQGVYHMGCFVYLCENAPPPSTWNGSNVVFTKNTVEESKEHDDQKKPRNNGAAALAAIAVPKRHPPTPRPEPEVASPSKKDN